jgi:radical SAM protein with 4Fe4S-binding SPASM domain
MIGETKGGKGKAGMANVILTDDPGDLGQQAGGAQVDCACDCDCACPIEGSGPLPVLDLPVAYYLELTPRCNNRCPGCGNVYAPARARVSSPSPDRPLRSKVEGRGGGKASRPLDGDEWQALIARLAAHAHHLKLTGGEPTLHPDFPSIVCAVEDHGLSFALFTNGRWPDPGATVRLLRWTPACDGLLVSLHGPDAATHEAFSGVPGSFGETTANLRRATEAGLEAAVSLVLTRHNWDRVQETLDLARSLGAHHVVCNRWIGAPGLGLAPSTEQLRSAIATVERLRRASASIRFGNCIPQCFEASSSTGCTAGRTFATIDPWGRMRPCNHAPLVAGNLRTAPIESIWHGPQMARWRDMVPVDCKACAAYAACHGGCRAQALLSGKAHDPLLRQPLHAPSLPVPALSLYRELRPVGQYTIRRESGRALLIHKNQVAVVPAALSGRWPRLDGSQSLHEIQTHYGEHALAWVGQCYRQGMVT